MNQNQPLVEKRNQKIIYWLLAAEPIILVGIALFLKTQGEAGRLGPSVSDEPYVVISSAISLIFIWISFMAASDKKILPSATAQGNNLKPGSKRMVILLLAIVPGILGFSLYMLFGKEMHLLLFNGAALIIAVWNILKFNEGKQ
jgi:hypothetical protein